MSVPLLQSLNGKRQTFPGERYRKLQTHRSSANPSAFLTRPAQATSTPGTWPRTSPRSTSPRCELCFPPRCTTRVPSTIQSMVCTSYSDPNAGYDAFGDNLTWFRELEWKTQIFCGREVWKNPNALYKVAEHATRTAAGWIHGACLVDIALRVDGFNMGTLW